MLLTVTPDVNILLAASRDDHIHHRTAFEWLRNTLEATSNGVTLRLFPFVIASFLRLTTNKKIFPIPMSTQEAIAFIDAILAVQGAELVAVGHEWQTMRQICLDQNLTGDDIPDAWLAASVTALGEHLVTFDADFKTLLKRSQLTLLKG